jgi:hypothetical protein
MIGALSAETPDWEGPARAGAATALHHYLTLVTLPAMLRAMYVLLQSPAFIRH